jgi:SAM-dependent methyltransferase
MHDTALQIGRHFFAAYALPTSTIVELGAFNVNGTLRDVAPRGARYIGLDLTSGLGVDVVIGANASLPLASAAADIVVASSVLEHDGFFWQTFLEVARIAKPGGVIYINAPSNGLYHRYPVDNWRFYPDCGKALASWAVSQGYDLVLIESFIAERANDVWNDFVAIFRKGASASAAGAVKFLSDSVRCTNVWRAGEAAVRFEREGSEDMLLIHKLRGEVKQLRGELAAASAIVEQLRRGVRSSLAEHSPPVPEAEPAKDPRRQSLRAFFKRLIGNV